MPRLRSSRPSKYRIAPYLASCAILGLLAGQLRLPTNAASPDIEPIPSIDAVRAEYVPHYEPSALPIADDAELTVSRAIAVACTGKGKWCVPTLTAIAWHESRFDPNAKGDYIEGVPVSRGAFQIRTDFPRRPTVEEANDPLFAARWTLDRLERGGWDSEKRPTVLQIQAHNGLASCGWKPGRCSGGYWAEYGYRVRDTAMMFHSNQ